MVSRVSCLNEKDAEYYCHLLKKAENCFNAFTEKVNSNERIENGSRNINQERSNGATQNTTTPTATSAD